jgi:hypothetical protein
VPAPAGRVCSNDTSALVSQVEGPPAPPEMVPEVPEDAGMVEDDAAAPVEPDGG